MRIIMLFLFMTVFALVASGQSPKGLPSPYSNGFSQIGYSKSDSGVIYTSRDTNWLPRFANTVVLWKHDGVDTCLWVWNTRWSILSSANYTYAVATAYVETFGVDNIAQIGRHDKPFKTINAALDALGVNGGTVDLGYGVFDEIDSSKIHSNLWFKGAGQPVSNWVVSTQGPDTLTITPPTRLLGTSGTVIKGTMYFMKKANLLGNIKITNLGIDVGKDYCNSQTDTSGREALFISQFYRYSYDLPSADHIHELQSNFPPMYGVVVDHVTTLCRSAIIQSHAMLIENVINPVVTNNTLIYGGHGLVIKSIGGMFTNNQVYACGMDALIIKSDDYANCHDVVVNGFYGASIFDYDCGGIILQGLEYPLTRISISNFILNKTKTGITNQSNESLIQYCNISNGLVKRPLSYGIFLRGKKFWRNSFSNITLDGAQNNLDASLDSISDNIFDNIRSFNGRDNGINISNTNGATTYLSNSLVSSSGQWNIVWGSNTYAKNVTSINGVDTLLPADYLYHSAGIIYNSGSRTYGYSEFGSGKNHISMNDSSFAFNRNVATGASFDSTTYGFQWIKSANNLNLQVWNQSGIAVTSSAISVASTGNVNFSNSITASGLTLNGTTSGLLIQRMTTTQRDAIIAPPEGLEIYNITTHTINFFNGSVWKAVITD